MSLKAIIAALSIAEAEHHARRSEISTEIVDLRRKAEGLGDELVNLGSSLDKIQDHIAALSALDHDFIDALMPPALMLPDLTEEQSAELIKAIETAPPGRIMMLEPSTSIYRIPGTRKYVSPTNKALHEFLQRGNSDEFVAEMLPGNIRMLVHYPADRGNAVSSYGDDNTLAFKDAFTTIDERQKRAGPLAQQETENLGTQTIAEFIEADIAREAEPAVEEPAEVAEPVEDVVEQPAAESDVAAEIPAEEPAAAEEALPARDEPEQPAAEEPPAVEPEPKAEEPPAGKEKVYVSDEQQAEQFMAAAKEIVHAYDEAGQKLLCDHAKLKIGWPGKMRDLHPTRHRMFLVALQEVTDLRDAEVEAEEAFELDVKTRLSVLKSEMDRKVMAQRTMVDVHRAGVQLEDLPADLRAAYLNRLDHHINVSKLSGHPLPDVRPEMPDMTQDDQDVILVMRDNKNAEGVCILPPGEIASMASVRKAALEGDILPRLVKVGKLVRQDPAFPERYRVADADASFAVAGAAKGAPLPETASIMLSRGARSIQGKVWTKISQSAKDGVSTMRPRAAALDIGIKVFQWSDAVDALVRDGIISIENGAATGWAKYRLLKTPAAS